MDPTIQWLVGVAAGLTALGVIWTKLLHPLIKAINAVEDAAPTLLKIADDFTPNSGGSLHDKITRIDTTLQDRTEVIDRIDTDLHQHIQDDKEALAVTRAAAELAVTTALELKADTAAIAAALEVKTEERAADLKVKTEEIATHLKDEGPPPKPKSVG